MRWIIACSPCERLQSGQGGQFDATGVAPAPRPGERAVQIKENHMGVRPVINKGATTGHRSVRFPFPPWSGSLGGDLHPKRRSRPSPGGALCFSSARHELNVVLQIMRAVHPLPAHGNGPEPGWRIRRMPGAFGPVRGDEATNRRGRLPAARPTGFSFATMEALVHHV